MLYNNKLNNSQQIFSHFALYSKTISSHGSVFKLDIREATWINTLPVQNTLPNFLMPSLNSNVNIITKRII